MFRLANELADRVALAWFVLEGVEVVSSTPALAGAIQDRIAQLRDRFPDTAAAADIVAPARTLYKALGIDPSRRRPSSEALLRRIIQGKGLYSVNSAVDAANLASLDYFLPVGLYDFGKIEPADGVVLRLGHPDEEYEGIGKGAIHVGGRPTLADARGAFGNPSSDSLRTSVDVETRQLLFVTYAPLGVQDSALAGYRARSIELLTAHVGGNLRLG